MIAQQEKLSKLLFSCFLRCGILPLACLLTSMATVQAVPTLVGTVVSPSTETIGEINDLINDFNTDFGASLPNVVDAKSSLVDKLDGNSFELNKLELDDFDFYDQDDSGSRMEDIFDATDVTFKLDASPNTNVPVMGFVYNPDEADDETFFYYVSKDGSKGWSLWAFMDEFNPVYTDAGTGASSIVGSGFTRGAVTNASLDYDPALPNAISHISFYAAEVSSGPPGVIPEPASLAIWGIALAVVGAGHRRREQGKGVRQRKGVRTLC